MANYTIELRTITDTNIDIFDFNYPIFEESYRHVFEQKFIDHFYFREIGVETVSRFKHNLKSQLNLLMPHYNKMYKAQNLDQRILDNYEVVESFEKTNTENGVTDRANNVNKTGVNEITNKTLFSDTGRKRVDINDVDYVSNISKDLNNQTSNSDEELTEKVESTNNNTENWVRKMSGNIGVQTDAEAVRVFCDNIMNIDLMVFEELDNLFMQVW